MTRATRLVARAGAVANQHPAARAAIMLSVRRDMETSVGDLMALASWSPRKAAPFIAAASGLNYRGEEANAPSVHQPQPRPRQRCSGAADRAAGACRWIAGAAGTGRVTGADRTTGAGRFTTGGAMRAA